MKNSNLTQKLTGDGAQYEIASLSARTIRCFAERIARLHERMRMQTWRLFAIVVPALFLALLALGTNGCTTVGGEVVQPTLNEEVVSTEMLQAFLKKHPRPAIALHTTQLIPQRVTKSSSSTRGVSESSSLGSGWATGKGSAWGSASTEGSFESNTKGQSVSEMKLSDHDNFRRLAYDEIEKEFVRAGFVVRDRRLLNSLVENNTETAGYAKIAERIKADIIIEITDFDFALPMKNYDFIDEKGVEQRTNTTIITRFNKTRGKIVIVENGQVGGMFEFLHIRPYKMNIWVSVSNGGIEKFRSNAPAKLVRRLNVLDISCPTYKESAQYFAKKLIQLLTAK